MTISESSKVELSANGLSSFVPLRPEGSVVIVDCVDADGESQDWGGASVDLIYSPDGKMQAAARDGNGDVTSQTDGFTRRFPVQGYVGIKVSGYTSGSISLLVMDE